MDEQPKNKTLVILVTYNGEKWVDYCIGSVYALKNVEIVCIDNASVDKTCELIKTNYPDVRLIKNKENVGFGKANNIGLKICLDEEFDYAFLLNQDARVEPDTIDQLVRINSLHPQYGLLSPVHRGVSNGELDKAFSMYIAENKTPGYTTDLVLSKHVKDVYETKFVNAALWLISKKCLESVGFFDPIFPHYGEDDDYIIRVKASGLKVGIVPGAFGNHSRISLRPKGNSSLNSDRSRYYVSLLLDCKYRSGGRLKKSLFYVREMMVQTVASVARLERYKLALVWFGYPKIIWHLVVQRK